MASETVVIARQSSTLSIVGTVKGALVLCDEQDRKPDLCEEMRKAADIPAERSVAAVNLNIAIPRDGGRCSGGPFMAAALVQIQPVRSINPDTWSGLLGTSPAMTRFIY